MIGGHGHVKPRPDGMLARCGGPGMCALCNAEYAREYGRSYWEDRVAKDAMVQALHLKDVLENGT